MHLKCIWKWTVEWKQTGKYAKVSDKLLMMVKLIDQIDTNYRMKVKQSGRQNAYTPANYISAYVYAGHFILGVHTRTPGHLISGVLAKFLGVYNTPIRQLTEALVGSMHDYKIVSFLFSASQLPRPNSATHQELHKITNKDKNNNSRINSKFW